MDSLKTTLQKFYQNIWPDIPEETMEVIFRKYTLVKYKKGTVILRPGDVCTWTAIVTEGIVRYYHTSNGKEHIGQFYFPGMVFSDYVSYVQGSPSRISIDAIKDCSVAIIKKEDSEKLREKLPGYLEMILRYLNQIYITNFDRNSSMILDSAETRYLKLIQNRPEILQQIPLYMVASYLGITPEVLSRIRKKISISGH
jgi:CRP/FNR family transcriptional regulator, anaerobic regulatory protein